MTKISDAANKALVGTEKLPMGANGSVPISTTPNALKTFSLSGLSTSDVSDFTASVSANTDVAASKVITDFITLTEAFDLDAAKVIIDFITLTGAIDLDSIKTLTDFITITQAVDLDAIETKVNSITVGDNGSIITSSQLAQLVRAGREETTQALSGGTPTLNCDSGYNADFPMTVNAVINLTNAPAGLVSGGEVILRNTNSYTLTMTLAGSSVNVAKMVGAEDLPAGASDTAILTWIYDGTYLTYNIGKRTEA